jgi:hypothetical protein
VLFLGAGHYSSQWPGGEIFDPASGKWKLTANPHEVGGAGQAVVRLRDGRFLVVGNKSVWADPISYDEPRAEIYDVASDTWTVVSRPAYSGEGSGAALLPDGRVLVAGGRPGGAAGVMIDATAHRGSEIFDPATGTWSSTGDLLRQHLAYHRGRAAHSPARCASRAGTTRHRRAEPDRLDPPEGRDAAPPGATEASEAVPVRNAHASSSAAPVARGAPTGSSCVAAAACSHNATCPSRRARPSASA